jgi:mannose-1-phosphate guanylyltransferase / phosphomannomutase
MKEALAQLKKQTTKINPPTEITLQEWENFAKNCTVVLMAGGESSRFGIPDVNKNAFVLPNGDTMIEMTIRLYRDTGIKDFVALVYHKGQIIEELLGDGTKLGVSIRYSYDPDKPVGKGGAIKNAFENGALQPGKYFIVHNPDDVILNFPKSFPKYIASAHLEGEKKGAISTVVVVEETPYSYTGMTILDNKVKQIEMYPMIPIPTHIGVTIFSPEAKEYFDKMFDYSEKQDFEKLMFPVLADEEKLNAVSISNDCWLAVNNPKSYKQLLKALNLE